METNNTHSATTPAGRRPKTELIGIGLLGVALLTAGVLPRLQRNHALAQGQTEQKEDEVAPVVDVAKLPLHPPTTGPDAAAAAPVALTLPASIMAIEETTINARTTGYLRARFVDIGSRVKAGQLLADIQSPDVDQQTSQAQADLAKSRAGTGQAVADSARLNAGIAQARAGIDQARTVVDQAKAGHKKALAELAQMKVGVASAEARRASSQQALEGRKADLEQLKAQLVLDQKDQERWQALGKQGAVAQEAVDSKESAYQARLASINSSQAAIHSAEADLEAAVQAVAASESAVDAAKADVSTSEQAVLAAKAQLASSGANLDASRASALSGQENIHAAQAQVQSSDANLQHFAVLRGFEQVTAPFAGIITARNVDTGALITIPTAGSSAPLFALSRTDTLRILVNVPQSYIQSIRPGGQVNVIVREFGGKPFIGTIFSTAGALDATSRTLLTEIHVPNPTGKLLPGMYAQVQFPGIVTGGSTAPRIPSEALINDALGTHVATVTPDKTVHFATVTISRDYGTTLEVSDGLKGDETLILNPGDDLKEGMPVRIAPPPKAAAAPGAPAGAGGAGEAPKRP